MTVKKHKIKKPEFSRKDWENKGLIYVPTGPGVTLTELVRVRGQRANFLKRDEVLTKCYKLWKPKKASAETNRAANQLVYALREKLEKAYPDFEWLTYNREEDGWEIAKPK